MRESLGKAHLKDPTLPIPDDRWVWIIGGIITGRETPK
jgi:hypothetical protein